MDIEKVRLYCLSKENAEETIPFGDDAPVYKVHGKMFLLLNLNRPFSINVKCDPEKALELREQYPSVTPGYHMNKKHWNTVQLESNIAPKLICEWIDDSYNLVVGKKKQ
ncbi:MAG: MmcQ/YjbR family DNA-binding protein [Ignavibacteriales bacterium]|nr:MmcQ/YjbR family DNA-binding protein [Ignavibacteriales bacterium]